MRENAAPQTLFGRNEPRPHTTDQKERRVAVPGFDHLFVVPVSSR